MALQNALGDLALDSSVKGLLTDTQLRAKSVTVGNPFGEAVGKNLARVAGSGRVSLTVAGNLRMVVSNPSTQYWINNELPNTRVAYLWRISIFTTAMGWATLIHSPQAGGYPPPSARRPKMNPLLGNFEIGATEYSVDPLDVLVDTNTTTALTGLGTASVVFGIPGNQRTTLDLPPFVLRPGYAIGLNVPFAGSADATVNLYWSLAS